jgi:signal transduction histidine kinase
MVVGMSRSTRESSEDTVWVNRSFWIAGKAVAQVRMPSTRRPTTDHDGVRRRELSHDIRHQLATVKLLASLLESAPDVGPDSRQRASQLHGETRWLERLLCAYDGTAPDESAEPIRIDLFAADVVGAVRLSTSSAIRFTADEAWAYADPLEFWRALRNMLGNALRAAGPSGRVTVRIENHGDWVLAEVDDDGPGFGAVPPGSDSLGLSILRTLAASWGGHLEVGRGALGGCRVRLHLRAAAGRPEIPVGEDHAPSDL